MTRPRMLASMLLPLSRAVSPDLDWRESCSSTNTELVARADELPDLSVLATAEQTAGRGRLDRVWSAPPGKALAVSVLVRHDGVSDSTGYRGVGQDPVHHGAQTDSPAHHGAALAAAGRPSGTDPRRLGWLPLVAGVAMARAVRTLGVASAGVKWPNDVLVDGGAGGPLKLSGILTELTPAGVVIGAGLNLSMTRDELPVPTATSLALQGVAVDAALADRALAAYLRDLLPLVAQWRAVTDPSELRHVVEPELRTLGRAVRVDRPGLPLLLGTAEGLDDDGRLLVRSSDPVAGLVAVAAGDVTHLRYE